MTAKDRLTGKDFVTANANLHLIPQDAPSKVSCLQGRLRGIQTREFHLEVETTVTRLFMAKDINIVNTIHIQRSMEEVFNYVTTPAHWPEWHPTPHGVSGATDHSLKRGEQVLEHVKFGFLNGNIRWTVRESVPPRLWIFDGVVEGVPLLEGTRATITYTLSAKEGGTLFKRELIYQTQGLLADLLNFLFFKAHNIKQSQVAVSQLKAVMEK
jgi:uncharacterized protein YndB with AHSA1/START domain